jgi:uncharacterized ion transporter superfamily protein YfcC
VYALIHIYVYIYKYNMDIYIYIYIYVRSYVCIHIYRAGKNERLQAYLIKKTNEIKENTTQATSSDFKRIEVNHEQVLQLYIFMYICIYIGIISGYG